MSDLSKYGKIEIYEETNDIFHVKITDGFEPTTINT